MSLDLRFAIRYLFANRWFACVAILSLAFGISSATVMYTVVRTVLLAPLPFPGSDRIIAIEEMDAGQQVAGSPQRFRDWSRAPSVERVAAYYGDNISVRFGEIPERVPGIWTFGDIVETFNATPAMGRAFTPAEKTGKQGCVAIVTHDFWRVHFGGDSRLIGAKVSLNGAPCEIVGVLAPGARIDDAEIVAPERQQDLPRSARFLMQAARLRAGATLARARLELQTVAEQLRREYPATDKNVSASATDMRDYFAAPVRSALVALMSVVGLLLLIASVDSAGLAVSRIASRRREIAVRVALGATRLAVARMVLIECAVLTAAGGVLAAVACGWELDLLRATLGADLPRIDELGFSGAVLAFGLCATSLAGLVAGVFPAWSAASKDIQPGLSRGGRSATRSYRMQSALAGSEVAISVVLVVCGGLLFRSVWNLEHRQLGFGPVDALTFRLALPWQTEKSRTNETYERVIAAIRAIPGVDDVALADRLPLGGPTMSAEPDVEGRDPTDFAGGRLAERSVSSNFQRVMKARPLAGRLLEQGDAPARRAVLNASAARLLFPAGDALGRRVGLRFGGARATVRFEVVGVIEDIPEYARSDRPSPSMYVPFQQTFWPAMSFIVQSRASPEVLAPQVRAAVARIAPDNGIEAVQTLRSYLDSRTRSERVQALLVALFGIAATLLAAMGVYGLAARRAAEGRRELAIRIALGAPPARAVRSAIGPILRLAAFGSVAGLIIAAAIVRAFRSTLFGVDPVDAPTYALAVAALMMAALLASWRPVRIAATGLNPAEILEAD